MFVKQFLVNIIQCIFQTSIQVGRAHLQFMPLTTVTAILHLTSMYNKM